MVCERDNKTNTMIYLICSAFLLIIIFIVGFGVYLKTNMNKESLKEIRLTEECLTCYMKNDLCSQTVCSQKMVPDVFPLEFQRRESPISLRKKIMHVIKEEINDDKRYENIEAHLKRSYRHADQVQYQLNKLNEMVYHPFKPVAHLSGSRYLDASPSPTGVKNEYRNNIWEYRNRVYESKVLYGMSYNHTTGTLTVPHGGLYYVYLHTTFYTRYSDKSHDSCVLGHVIRHGNKNSDLNIPEQDLAMSRESRSCQFDNTTLSVFRNDEEKSNIGFHSLDLSGVHKLKENDQLTVFYQMPPNVGIATLHRETYFGVFML